MFTIKYDLFFPTIEAAKEIARKLNARRNACDVRDADPREVQRMRDELRAVRETHRLKMTAHRNGIL
ncbi:MAG: hypothetical protein HC855_13460 [Rhizobiales bacterium]|nr:hypothetical protein [Hyphomicrobiales bacterium]